MRRLAAIVLCLLVQPAFAADDPDAFQMTIDAGRLGVMMDQSQRILALPDDPPSDGNTATFAILKSAVQKYQRLKPMACDKLDVELCGPTYAPAWLSETDEPAPAVLRTRIDEATDHVAPLWNDLCAALPVEHDPSLCQIE